MNKDLKTVQYKGYWFPETNKEIHYDFSIKRVKSLQWILKNWNRKKIVVQAGGSYGVWPKLLGEHFEYVYTFEPDYISFHHLVLNCTEPNIFKSQMALSDKRRCLNFKRKSFTGHKVINTGGDGYHPATSVDSLGLWNLDALLLDIEGYEFFALYGANNTIKEFKPIILIEVPTDESQVFYGKEPGAPQNYLKDELGYKKVAHVGHDDIFVPKEMEWKTE